MGASCPGSKLVYLPPHPLQPCPQFGSGSVISQFLFHHNLGIFSCKRYKHYFNKTEMFTSNIQIGYSCPGGGGGQSVQAGLSPPPLRPLQDLDQTVSSVNSYCTIILESFIIVRDTNIIPIKLRWYEYQLFRGVGGKLSRLQAGLSCRPPNPHRFWVWQCHQPILIAP